MLLHLHKCNIWYEESNQTQELLNCFFGVVVVLFFFLNNDNISSESKFKCQSFQRTKREYNYEKK